MAKIRKKKKQYRSDFMSRKMDDRLEQLEETLTALYANASLETQAELYAFTKNFKKAYEEMLAKKEAGDITDSEFQLWCNKKIVKTEQYKKTIDSLTNMLVNTDKKRTAFCCSYVI